jgi:hypothetical protein
VTPAQGIDLLLSIGLIVLGVLAYRLQRRQHRIEVHQTDINRQLAELQIEEIETARGARVRAEVFVDLTRKRLILHNRGMAPAHDVRVEFHVRREEAPVPANILSQMLPIDELGPDQKFPIIAVMHSGTPPVVRGTIRWTESGGEERSRDFSLSTF